VTASGASGDREAEAATHAPAKQGRIFFARDSDPGPAMNPDIHAIRADGGGLVNLTPGRPGSDAEPSVDPTGRWVAFRSTAPEGSEVWMMRSNGTGVVRLVPNADHPEFSPDGTRIVFARRTEVGMGSQSDLWSVKRDGTGLVRLTHTDSESENLPTFSPDGRRIAFTAGESSGEFDVYSMAVDGTDRRPVAVSARDDVLPAYSPDGRRIAFTRLSPNWIFIVAADGTGEFSPMPGWAGGAFGPVWSPDGRTIAFDNDIENLFTVPAAGGAVTALTSDPQSDFSPTWEHVFRCAGRRATIVGDLGPDKIKGTKKADVIVANAGKDKIRGRGGKDRICAGKGRDLLVGGKGADILRGGKGKDKEKQ
jgi:Tol biopolymer transport system component